MKDAFRAALHPHHRTPLLSQPSSQTPLRAVSCATLLHPPGGTNHTVKFADDTTAVGLIRDDNNWTYREEVEQLAGWCRVKN